MFNKAVQNFLNTVFNTFKNDTGKIIIATGALGFGLSSAAQIGAILMNKKISNEKKSFLIPQEFLDGAVNILAFLGITMVSKYFATKLVTTGKILPKSTRDFVNMNYKDNVGKLDFNMDKIIKDAPQTAMNNYKKYKNMIATTTTLGASIFSSNLVAPIARNSIASSVQKSYIQQNSEYNPVKYSGDMKI